MKGKQDLSSILQMVRGLSEEQQNAIAEQIMSMLSAPQKAENKGCAELIETTASGKPDCPHCSAKASLGYIIKRGMKGGSQRYLCKSCGRYFVPTTNTAFAWSRKDAETWRKFIRLTITGASLHVCCDECHIAYQTAFTWRHKVLNAFVVNQNATQMTGTVEVDEMLIPISYKGNHIKGSFGARRRADGADSGLPRESHKRGTDNKPKSSKDRACVFCMVEDGNKSFYAAVPGVGFMSPEMLQHTVGKHVNKDTALMLADSYRITRTYFEENGYNHRILSSNTSDNPHEHKPEVVDGLHMQHVNSMHAHIRNFLKRYYGVSSKYLEHYMALYVWLKSVGLVNARKGADKASVARAATPDCYVSRKAIESRPAVPMCA